MASRIFVKGLPPTFSEEEMRKHFAGEVTDVKIFPGRRIGFIGYKTAEAAQKAVKYYNKSFIRMSRISVELAKPVKQDMPLSTSEAIASKDATHLISHANSADSKRKRDTETAEKEDAKLGEFLEVMRPKTKRLKAWENDVKEEEQTQVDPSPAAQSDDEYEELDQRKRQPKSESISPSVAITTREEEPKPGVNGENGQESAGEDVQPQPDMSDSDWARSRTSRLLGLENEDEEEHGEPFHQHERHPLNDSEAVLQSKGFQSGVSQPELVTKPSPSPTSEQASHETAEAGQTAAASGVVDVRSSMRLFVRNLPYDATAADLEAEFAPYGNLDEVHISTSKKTGATKGFAFIQFSNPDSAEKALQEKDGQLFQGRLLHVLPAQAKRESKLDDFELAKLPLKKQQEIKRRREAAAKTFNWNALYMNADAVVSSVADRLGIAKSAVLDPTSSDAAVKQAHAETHIIQETKAYFKQQGVDLDAFKRSQRGDTAILAKNIPYDCSRDELRRRFEEHGDIIRFLMPPSGTIAIVEYANAEQCKAAYGALAYRRVKSSILMLEKAPKDLFSGNVPTNTPDAGEDAVVKTSASELKDARDYSVPNNIGTATLFVRNLNFSTTTDRLTETFKPLSGFLSARVKTKTDAKKPGQTLSMGFGFLEFRTSQQAQAALQAMDGYTLDGHKLQIRASHKGADAAAERRQGEAAKRNTKTKIIIKNLPFEASKKDVRALFGAYGQLRAVRVPKKMDRGARGFAFADFTTPKEAESAMDALRNTHLLGRRLVLEFAEGEPEDAEAEIERMAAKVGAQVNKVALRKLTGGGRKKFSTANDEDGGE